MRRGIMMQAGFAGLLIVLAWSPTAYAQICGSWSYMATINDDSSLCTCDCNNRVVVDCGGNAPGGDNPGCYVSPCKVAWEYTPGGCTEWCNVTHAANCNDAEAPPSECTSPVCSDLEDEDCDGRYVDSACSTFDRVIDVPRS
jgi:hypothetical protein